MLMLYLARGHGRHNLRRETCTDYSQDRDQRCSCQGRGARSQKAAEQRQAEAREAQEARKHVKLWRRFRHLKETGVTLRTYNLDSLDEGGER